MRSVLADRHGFERHLQKSDTLLVPPLPADMSILDWTRHGELVRATREWMAAELLRQRAGQTPAFALQPSHGALVRAQRRDIDKS
jgi:hypothetical protein